MRAARQVLLIICFGAALADASDLAVLRSPDVHDTPSHSRIRAILAEVAVDFHVREESLPNLVVIFATRQDADAQRLPKSVHVVADRLVIEGTVLYHLWIIDDPTDVAVVAAIVTTVNREVMTTRSNEELDATARRISLRLKNKISAQDLRRER